MPKHIEALESLRACSDARDYAATKRTAQQAWDDCVRGDWMLWLCGKLSGKPESEERKKLVLCAVECARLAPPIKRKDWEQARLACLDTAERWARGKATIDELRQARMAAAADAAYAAAYAAYAADAAYADAAYAAAYAAYAAAYAAYAADAAYAAADAARATILKQCADIVRRHYPKVPSLPRVKAAK